MAAIPSPPTKRVLFNEQMLEQLSAAVGDLEGRALLGKVPGFRLDRKQLRDWIQASLSLGPSHIREVSLFGRGFFQVLFDDKAQAEQVLAKSPILVGGRIIFLAKWTSGFSAADTEWGDFPVTLRFPGLPSEYRGLLRDIGAAFGVVLEGQPSLAAVVAEDGVPKVRVLVQHPSDIPEQIELPRLDGSFLTQKVELAGLPGQCLR